MEPPCSWADPAVSLALFWASPRVEEPESVAFCMVDFSPSAVHVSDVVQSLGETEQHEPGCMLLAALSAVPRDRRCQSRTRLAT